MKTVADERTATCDPGKRYGAGTLYVKLRSPQIQPLNWVPAKHPRRATRASARGRPDSRQDSCLQSYVTSLYKAAGIKASSHSGRRPFATRLLGRGTTIELVQLLLGHESSDDTRRFIDVDREVLSRLLEEAI
ncbi:tyrosine-type recombinase/integrase [Burkholderia metallica]